MLADDSLSPEQLQAELAKLGDTWMAQAPRAAAPGVSPLAAVFAPPQAPAPRPQMAPVADIPSMPARPASPEEEWLRVFRPVSEDTPLVRFRG